MDALQELVEMEALRRLKARYFFYLDSKQWESWLALFTPEATLEWDHAVSAGGRDGTPSTKCVGVEDIERTVVNGALKNTNTVHHGHTPLIEIVSPTEARGIWAMQDLVSGERRNIQGSGYYHETYRKVDGEWKIASLHLTRLRVTNTLL